MKLLKVKVKGIELFKDTMEIDFFAEQRIYADHADMLSNVFGSIYTNNVISFVGINASGKTSTLNLLTFLINMLNSESINNISNKWILEGSKEVCFDSYFYHNDMGICKLETIIKQKDDYLNQGKYYISKESLWVKKEKSYI